MSGWNRREFIGAASLLALAFGLPLGACSTKDLDESAAPTDRQRNLIAQVSDLVIPKTDTPGAREVGAGDFVILALAHGLGGTGAPLAPDADAAAFGPFQRKDGSLDHLAWLEDSLDKAAGGDFLKAAAKQQESVLAALDAAAFAEGAPYSPWKAIKGLVLTGYYTSEAGGSKELRYELVPGKWEPNIAKEPGMAASSSDWTAVDFG